MKKFSLLPLFFIITLSFCFVKDVKADSILPITSTQFDELNSQNFLTMKSYMDEQLSNSAIYNNYIIYKNASDWYMGILFTPDTPPSTWPFQDVSGYFYRNGNSFRLNLAYTSSATISFCPGAPLYNSSPVLTSSAPALGTTNAPVTYNLVASFYDTFLYSTYSFKTNESVDLYENGDYNVISYEFNRGEVLPFLNQLHDIIDPPAPPPPPDNTPLLTSFYNIVIEKLSLIADYFSSHYIYLSIFVVFLFVFFVYLIKRRF